jgi:hypothetical protein
MTAAVFGVISHDYTLYDSDDRALDLDSKELESHIILSAFFLFESSPSHL